MDSESLAEPQAWISGLSYPNKLTPTSLLPITQQAGPIFESEQLRVITASFLILQLPLNTLRYTQSSWIVDCRKQRLYLLPAQKCYCTFARHSLQTHDAWGHWPEIMFSCSLTSNDVIWKSSALILKQTSNIYCKGGGGGGGGGV
jgi:hypothetical protein